MIKSICIVAGVLVCFISSKGIEFDVNEFSSASAVLNHFSFDGVFAGEKQKFTAYIATPKAGSVKKDRHHDVVLFCAHPAQNKLILKRDNLFYRAVENGGFTVIAVPFPVPDPWCVNDKKIGIIIQNQVRRIFCGRPINYGAKKINNRWDEYLLLVSSAVPRKPSILPPLIQSG